MNIVNTNLINLINFAVPSGGNFLVECIKWLVSIGSSVAVGIILFTLILKLITLPFDFISRASMRKNNLKLEAMRPDLEKLKKQYENDKATYNQKLMALYKKNGYSMMASCLPTIITLVIFIVAINAFTSYAGFQNKQDFYNMSLSYNQVVYNGIEDDFSENKYIINEKDGIITINDDKIIKDALGKGAIANGEAVTLEGKLQDGTTSFNYTVELGEKVELVKDIDGNTVLEEGTNIPKTINVYWYNIASQTDDSYIILKRFYTAEEKDVDGTLTTVYTSSTSEYYVNEEALKVNTTLKNTNDQTYSQFIVGQTGVEGLPVLFLQNLGQAKSAETYRNQVEDFLWISNIWVSDNPWSHPVSKDWESFKGAHGYQESATSSMNQASYEQLVAQLDDQVTKPNGYLGLVILCAVVTFLSQWISTRSQKAQMEFQANGGSKSGRVMMVMMPLMMTVFSVFYTAAFSIYMVLSSVISIGTTLLINWIVGRRFKKGKYDIKKDKGKGDKDKTKKQGYIKSYNVQTSGGEKREVIRGRVYTPKQQPIEEKKKKEKPVKQKKVKNKGDFMGEADMKTNTKSGLFKK